MSEKTVSLKKCWGPGSGSIFSRVDPGSGSASKWNGLLTLLFDILSKGETCFFFISEESDGGSTTLDLHNRLISLSTNQQIN